MSEPAAAVAFLPWLRRGVGTQIIRVDGTTPPQPEPRARMNVRLGFNSNSLGAGVELSLFGPGEVGGFDSRCVIRTWPRPDVLDAEPNYFPLVEFDQADLPWRYTPARATGQDRLRPWMCLIVVRDDEVDAFTPPGPERPLPVVRVKSASSLPKLSQSWAWVHVQLSGRKTATPAESASLLGATPHIFLARLVCPRRMDPRTAYSAYVIPTFERGRLAGLQQTLADTVDALTPAWADGQNGIDLPVYFQWRFTTGEAGDFESLVRRLRARSLPPSVGIRPMDVSQPGAELPAASNTPLGLEGALKSLTTVGSVWNPADKSAFVALLAALLNRPEELLQNATALRVVAPPLYGRWHAARGTLDLAAQPPWFQDLNSDPRARVTAGLGTLVIQDQQDPLMASAWLQVERIREINEALRLAQLAREAAISIHQRHIAGQDLDAILLLSAPVHARVRTSPVTVRKLLEGSPIPRGVLEGQFRRVMRPLGPLGRRQGRAPAGRMTNLLDRLNQGKLTPAAPPGLPRELATLARAGGRLFVNMSEKEVARWLESLPKLIRDTPPRPRFQPVEHVPGRPPPEPQPDTGGQGHDNDPAGAFRAAAIDALTQLHAPPAKGVELRPVDLDDLRTKIITALDPRTVHNEGLRGRLQLAPGFIWEADDPIEPVMAYPEFPQPMYEPLRDLSQDWLLPGLDKVPVDTVSLLKTNQKFIESYMVGLNHEMARELLWNEYPTDQRGSYFRQFWDVRGYVGTPGDTLTTEELRDIKEIHAWRKTAALGQNSARKPPPGGDYLVLLVRGELLRRYPNTLVYAGKAKLGANNLRELDEEEKHPVFRGTLRPDVSFFGFELTEPQVRGSTNPAADQGWFFVLQEQPSEPRFGLDVPAFPAPSLTKWSDLTWAHLAADQAQLEALSQVDLDAALPNAASVTPQPGEPTVAWHAVQGSRSADLAFITLQRPVRIAVHGSDMLPTPGA